MKRIVTIVILGTITFTGCKKEEVTQQIPGPVVKTNIHFEGIWKRTFEAGPGNLHTANYLVYQDNIRYTLSGQVGNANYLMERDTFLLKNNRFIGHTNDNTYYLVFVKNVLGDSLTLYKQEVTDVNDGMTIDVPSDTTTLNHGWNNYYKQ